MDPLDEVLGPTLEITARHLSRAGDLWSILDLAEEGREVRVTVDWNGINARNWDMSFVPWK